MAQSKQFLETKHKIQVEATDATKLEENKTFLVCSDFESLPCCLHEKSNWCKLCPRRVIQKLFVTTCSVRCPNRYLTGRCNRACSGFVSLLSCELLIIWPEKNRNASKQTKHSCGIASKHTRLTRNPKPDCWHFPWTVRQTWANIDLHPCHWTAPIHGEAPLFRGWFLIWHHQGLHPTSGHT